jgi:hypothetical protein
MDAFLMMIRELLSIICMPYCWALVLCLACCASGDKDNPPAGSPPLPAGPALTVMIDGQQLRRTPGPEGEPIRALPAGSLVYDLGQSSDFTTRLYLRGLAFDEPWLKVLSEQGDTGWVFGAALLYGLEIGAEQVVLLMERRLQSLFGQAIYERLAAYRQSFFNLANVDDFAQCYREGLALRDTMVQIMNDRSFAFEGGSLPNLFWLRETTPGFVPQLIAQGAAYYLFADYRQWLQLAQRTPGKADDEFIQLCLLAFPQDSVEYFYPSWTIQISDTEGCSLLGRGLHQRMLAAIERLPDKTKTLFALEINAMKDNLLRDITRPDVRYWEAAHAIQVELQAIIAANHDCLSFNDRLTLATRAEHFADPGAFGILVNMKAGVE